MHLVSSLSLPTNWHRPPGPKLSRLFLMVTLKVCPQTWTILSVKTHLHTHTHTPTHTPQQRTWVYLLSSAFQENCRNVRCRNVTVLPHHIWMNLNVKMCIKASYHILLPYILCMIFYVLYTNGKWSATCCCLVALFVCIDKVLCSAHMYMPILISCHPLFFKYFFLIFFFILIPNNTN